MTSLALLLIGFSIFSASILAITHFRTERYREQPISRIMGLALLLALSTLQVSHFAWLYLDQAWVETLPYRMILFTVAPVFFLFSQPLLCPSDKPQSRPLLISHALPVILSPLLGNNVALPLAFIIGSGYLLWLAKNLFALRHERASFRLEILLLGGVFIIALTVSALGLIQTVLPEKLFFCLYAIAIGLAFFLVQTALGLRPELTEQVRDTVQSYASTTLGNVDCEAALSRLDTLMKTSKIYESADLSLSSLAEKLAISSHQLSELINTRLGKSFSRYLREQRISAAKHLLLEEPSASVLSIGLSAGFTSQSNFYEAFREVEGMTPGQYRKMNIK